MSPRPYLVIVCGGCGEDMTVESFDGTQDAPLQLVVHPCQKCRDDAVKEWRLRER